MTIIGKFATNRAAATILHCVVTELLSIPTELGGRIPSREKCGEIMKIQTKFALCAMLLAVPAAAQSAVVTKQYEVNAVFQSGPVQNLLANIFMTYDPTQSIYDGNISFTFDAPDGAESFGVPAAFNTFASGSQTLVVVGGSVNGAGVSASGTDDFYILFSVLNSGDLVSDAAAVGYTSATSVIGYGAVSARVRVVSDPVPEPETWAMMIGGLGLVGLTMRRRKIQISFA
jgi:hypothetical protein